MNAEISFNGHKWEILVIELNRTFTRATLQECWNFCKEYELKPTTTADRGQI